MLQRIVVLALIGVLLISTGCLFITDGGGPPAYSPYCVYYPDVTIDNSGGAIVTYQTRKAGGMRECRVQKIGPKGNLLWGERGTLIDSGYVKGCGWFLRIVEDGSGGAVIAWRTYLSNPDLKSPSGEQVQPVTHVIKVDSRGKVLWHKEVNVVDSAERMISDGAGGAIIACDDYRSHCLHLQKIDAAGDFSWGEDGVSIYREEYTNNSLQLAGDGSGGAIVIWQESSPKPGVEINQPETTTSIFAQRINSEGRLLWGKEGVLLYATKEVNEALAEVVSDGSGGAIVVWWQESQTLEEPLHDICAQRVDADGNVMWQSKDSPVFVKWQMEHAADPSLVSDDEGNAIVCWESDASIYAQKLDSSGEIMWLEDGIQVWQDEDNHWLHLASNVESDGSGGTIITWCFMESESRRLLRAQRLDADGRRLWSDEGVPVSDDTKVHPFLVIMSQDGLGGALITWGVGRDVHTVEKSYVQRIDSGGNRLWEDRGIRLDR